MGNTFHYFTCVGVNKQKKNQNLNANRSFYLSLVVSGPPISGPQSHNVRGGRQSPEHACT